MTKEKLITKSMKYKIKYDKSLYKILKDIQYDVWRIKNKATTLAYDWQQFSFSYNERFGCYPIEKDILGRTLTSDIYQQLKHMGENMHSSTYNTAVKEAVDKFKEQKVKILKGEESIINYKRNGSIPIRATQIKDIEKINNKTFTAKLSLLSNSYVKKLREELKEDNEEKEQKGKSTKKSPKDIKTQISVTLMSGGGATEILDRIISGEYKLGDSRITQDRKGNFYLSIVYKFPRKKVELDKNRVMGIDLGVSVPAMLAISDDKYYKMAVGDGQEILNFQNQINARKKRLQRSRKWAGKGSVGHGVKTRIKPLKRLSGKIARFKDHKNHVWSRFIVDEAVRNKCGVIQMEDLSGISNENSFLKTWTYYDLQEKIKYKAEEKGIEVVRINPKYTSQRCNRCGFINKENRKEQEVFKCVNCNHQENADLNAARNIAIKDIEKIIKDQLKIQERHMKNNLKYIAE